MPPRGLIDDALDVQARDAPGILGRLTLRIVEIGRDRDDGSVTGSPDNPRGLLHLHETRPRFPEPPFLALHFHQASPLSALTIL